MTTKLKYIADSEVTLSELMLPSHANFNNKIHGGYLLSLLDQIAFACASKHSGEYCVTASVDTVDFLNPIEIGELLTLKASVNYVGNSSMVIGIRVESENIRTGKIKHCNSSYVTMVAVNEKGKPVKIPGLYLTSENEIRRFVKSLKRIEMKHHRRKEFHELDFTAKDYIEKLKKHRVEILLK
ncbi:MAG: acyl-CoA thioesterase [Mesonia hippocampi]|uniref:acyl-CoA thioesterase n=1 Tax=Mesonia hippocampi TaxID=1628250 RepID=UPI003F9DE5FE